MKTKMIIKDQGGGAVIEFAIVLPLLVLLITGIIECSIMFYNKQVITNASREAARVGINGIDLSEIGDPDAYLRNIVNVYCFGDADGDGFNDTPRLITFGSAITAFPACGTASCIDINDGSGFSNVSTNIKVSVQYVYTFLIPAYMGLGPTITLYGQTVMRMF